MAERSARPACPGPVRRKLAGLGRALGGALIFALPMLMTMELWSLGFTMDRLRLAVLVVVAMPLLVGLAHHVGFEQTFGWREDLRDALIALAVGLVTSAAVLALFDVIDRTMPLDEVAGKLALQAVPASIGALLGRSQLGDGGEAPEGEAAAGYGGELFLMAAGALFLSLNVAPTEEMILISYMMSPWHALLLVLLSVLVMHAFVYAVGFRGGRRRTPGRAPWHDFLRFTLAGYAVCLAISLYVLWSFGRTDDLAAAPMLMATVVLAFPAAVGAAAARLML